MSVIELPRGRFIAKTPIPATSRLTAGPISFTVVVSSQRGVEHLLSANLNTDPQTNATIQGVGISGNSVGFTVYVATGTTVSGDVYTVGF